jgi:demethylmenaquinone methyltransferase/2-methoxy-6-polyprenyl-1,4-benzoquinol methylase
MSEGSERGEATTERVRTIFSRIAPTYDLLNHLTSFGIDRRWRRRAVELADLRAGDRVLDLAAGTGDLTLALARQARPAEVVSTDFVGEMLEIGREKTREYRGPTTIVFQEADAQALPFEDASFDAATIAFGVRNLPDRSANFREVHRVLRPGGRYVVLEFSTPHPAPIRWGYHLYLRHVVPTVGGLVSGDRAAYRYLNDSIRRFPSQAGLARELVMAGFRDVAWHDLTFGVVSVHVARKTGPAA